MPTWRLPLKFMTAKEVENSEYVRCWNEILSSERLAEFAEKQDLDIVFYPHFEMQKYLYMFPSKNDKIKIASIKDYDVQTLLKESKLLVTDFSSVYFDFAYMQKPVIHFQFDREEFFSSHYQKGYFDYDTMGFGPVVLKPEEVIDEIIRLAENSYEIDKNYKDRINGFFPLRDSENCKRIFEEIQKL